MSKPITRGDRAAVESSPAVTPVATPRTDPAALELTRLRELVELVGTALHLAEPVGSAR